MTSAVSSDAMKESLWSRIAQTMLRNHREMWRHIARRWYVYAVLLGGFMAASHYLGLNMTDSMSERLVWLEHGVQPARGDLVVFKFEGRGFASKFDGMHWFKRVVGLPGDRITVVDREVFVNGASFGHVAKRSPRGTELEPIEPGVVPPGYYYLSGSSASSFDSRYRIVGLVRSERIIARAHAIF